MVPCLCFSQTMFDGDRLFVDADANKAIHIEQSDIDMLNFHTEIKVNGKHDFSKEKNYDDISLIIVMKGMETNSQEVFNIYPKEFVVLSDKIESYSTIKIENIITPTIISYSESVNERKKNKNGYFQFQAGAKYYEVLAFEKSISKSKRSIAESYLAMKYGITLFSDYVNSNLDTIYKRTDNEGFNTNIVCIGRDDKTGLYQRQSKDMEGVLAVGLGTLESSNDANETEVKNNTFLFISDNGSFTKKENKNLIVKSERVWKIHSNDTFQTGYTGTFRINYKKIFGEPLKEGESIWLVLNAGQNNDTFSFDNGNLIKASKQDTINATFLNLDFSDIISKGYFQFIKAPDFFADVESVTNNCNSSGLKITPVGGGGNYSFVLTNAESGEIRKATSDDAVLFEELPAGIYNLTVTDNENRSYAQEFVIDASSFDLEEDIPEYEFLLPEGETLELDLSEYIPENAREFWWSSSEVVIDGEKSRITNTGDFVLFYSNSKGCLKQAKFVVKEDKESLLNSANLQLYPNPISANQPFTINVNLKDYSNIQMFIYSVNGQLIAEEYFENRKDLSINYKLQQAGVYIITIHTSEFDKNLKLIVNN